MFPEEFWKRLHPHPLWCVHLLFRRGRRCLRFLPVHKWETRWTRVPESFRSQRWTREVRIPLLSFRVPSSSHHFGSRGLNQNQLTLVGSWTHLDVKSFRSKKEVNEERHGRFVYVSPYTFVRTRGDISVLN